MLATANAPDAEIYSVSSGLAPAQYSSMYSTSTANNPLSFPWEASADGELCVL